MPCNQSRTFASSRQITQPYLGTCDFTSIKLDFRANQYRKSLLHIPITYAGLAFCRLGHIDDVYRKKYPSLILEFNQSNAPAGRNTNHSFLL